MKVRRAINLASVFTYAFEAGPQSGYLFEIFITVAMSHNISSLSIQKFLRTDITVTRHSKIRSFGKYMNPTSNDKRDCLSWCRLRWSSQSTENFLVTHKSLILGSSYLYDCCRLDGSHFPGVLEWFCWWFWGKNLSVAKEVLLLFRERKSAREEAIRDLYSWSQAFMNPIEKLQSFYPSSCLVRVLGIFLSELKTLIKQR